MRVRQFRYFVSDFETTVYKGQVHTEVWASASVEINTEDVEIFHSINEQFEYFKQLKENVVVYFHNLKFDGNFWLSHLLVDLQLEQAYCEIDDKGNVEWINEKYMKNNTFKYAISQQGQWYTIIIKCNNKIIEIRDSLKLLPFSLKRIGKAFKTKHQKLDMEYEGYRYAGCVITDEEKEYIRNDVLVIKEALEIMFAQGHNKLTIGSCCLAEYKKIMGREDYEDLFPDQYAIELDTNKYGYENVGEFIRKSYKGGWCYLFKGKENKVYKNGTTADVNSLYPSVMHSESGNRYPIGNPKFWVGGIPDEAKGDNKYYFVRLKTRFYLKPNKLPFIQIKNSYLYDGTDCLESSDVLNPVDGKYYTHHVNSKGELIDTRYEFVMTMTDYKLFKDHYDLVECEILGGCWYYALVGIFDEYIDKYKKIKLESTGALRELAKLFLNNLYGKMASSTDSSFKVAYEKPDKSIGFRLVTEKNKEAGYIPVGTAITSYARDFTIRHAQMNYKTFVYADTDSLHCSCPPEKMIGLKVHNVNFCSWKLEAQWDIAIFTRQKTYIEHVTHEDLKPVEPYYNVKCAGMPDRCKNLFLYSLQGYTKEEFDKLNEEEQEFVSVKRTLKDFNVGLCVPSKLKPKRIRGGVLLLTSNYEMR